MDEWEGIMSASTKGVSGTYTELLILPLTGYGLQSVQSNGSGVILALSGPIERVGVVRLGSNFMANRDLARLLLQTMSTEAPTMLAEGA